MDESAFDESLMFNEYHQKPGSPVSHHQHQPLLSFQQPGDMMGYALPSVPDHMQDMHHQQHHHHHHQLQDMDMHRGHHHHGVAIPDQMQQQQQQDRQIQIGGGGGGDPQDLFQMPVTSAAQVQPTDVANPNGQKHVKLELDANPLPACPGQQTQGTYLLIGVPIIVSIRNEFL